MSKISFIVCDWRQTKSSPYKDCILMMHDAALNLVAGATVGGGTRVNWSVSFKTPPHVRKEWAEKHGLPNFTSTRYDRALDAVCKRLAVRTGELRYTLRFPTYGTM